MKKVLFLTIICLNHILCEGQIFTPYNFTKLNAPYTNLSGATSLSAGVVWDDTVVVAPIGFNFKFINNTNSSDSIFFSTWGFLAFRNDYLHATAPIWMGRSMIPFAGDLQEKSYDIGGPALSDISYQTTGTAGSRIFKLECKNIGFWGDTALVDSLNFQVWLYENTNVIEFHYGPSHLDSNAWYWQDGGCRVGIYNDVTVDTISFNYTVNNCSYVTGDSSTASLNNVTTPFDFFLPNPNYVLTGGPNNGKVFRFTPSNNVGIENPNELFKYVRVNSFLESSQIVVEQDGEVNSYNLMNVNGQSVKQNKLDKYTTSISTLGMSTGVYFLKVFNNEGISKTFKLFLK